MWRHFKQTHDRRVTEWLYAILRLDSDQNAEVVSRILHVHPKMLKRWVNNEDAELVLTRLSETCTNTAFLTTLTRALEQLPFAGCPAPVD